MIGGQGTFDTTVDTTGQISTWHCYLSDKVIHG